MSEAIPTAWHQFNRLKSERRALHRYAGLCSVEPQLAGLLVELMRSQPSSAIFKEVFLPRIIGLVGEGSRKSLATLRSQWAYDTVYAVAFSMVYDKPRVPRAPDAREAECEDTANESEHA